MSSAVSPLVRELNVSVVERDVSAYLARHPALAHTPPPRISLASLPTPTTTLASAALAYSHAQLDPTIFNHSVRVYYIGQAMALHLSSPSSPFPPSSSPTSPPPYPIDAESYYLTSLLHDLGLAHAHHLTTRLSFEYTGAHLARAFILSHSPPSLPLADDVAEAIHRHTDLTSRGALSTTASLIQLSTTLDVVGMNGGLIDGGVYGEIEGRWPRRGFGEHFAALMEEEMRAKPWSHTTAVQEQFDFCARIRANPFTRHIDHPTS